MRIQIQLRIVGDDNSVISESEILQFDKGDDRLEVIGLSFDEAKAALVGIQGGVVTAQAASFLARHLNCDLCGSRLLSKGPGRTRFRTAFGTIALPSARFGSVNFQGELRSRQASAYHKLYQAAEIWSRSAATRWTWMTRRWARETFWLM
jgi:hypothetical protein